MSTVLSILFEDSTARCFESQYLQILPMQNPILHTVKNIRMNMGMIGIDDRLLHLPCSQ